MVYVIFQQKPDSPAKDKEVEDKGKGKEVGSARLEAVPRAEGLFRTIPDVQEARERLQARLESGGKGRRHAIPPGTPVPPHIRKWRQRQSKSASQPASRIAPLPVETVGESSSQPVVYSLFVLCCG